MKSKSLGKHLTTLQMKGQYWFSREEVIKELKLSKTAFRMAAYRLMKEKSINHIGQGFFVIVPVEYKQTGAPPPYWYIDQYLQYLGREYYICLLTAAAYHGASHQVSQQFHVMVEYPLKIRIKNPGNLVFFTKKNLRSTTIERIKVPTGYAKFSTKEATALDLVQYYRSFGGWGLIGTILFELVPSLDPKLISKSAEFGLYELATLQRFGYILDLLGHQDKTNELKELVNRKWKEKGFKKYFLLNALTPTRQKIEKNSKWRIVLNDTIEADTDVYFSG